MTSEQFIEHRVEELRQFFASRFGRFWLSHVRRGVGLKYGLHFLRDRTVPTPRYLLKVEQFAFAKGFKSYSNLPPFERKSSARAKILVDALGLVVFTDPIFWSRLCAMSTHKMRGRPLKDDVFPAEFRAKRCTDDRMLNPMLSGKALPEAIRTPSLAELPACPVVEAQGRGPARGVLPPRLLSLRASSAVKNLSREELKSVAFHCVTLLARDHRAPRAVRSAYLSRLQRRCEAFILGFENDEKLAAGKEIQ